MTARSAALFDVDPKGLAKLLEQRGKGAAVVELISNAFDTNATLVEVTLAPLAGRPYAHLIVADDDPDGFALALDTPIPTPDGWSTIGDLNIGDKVYDEQGRIRYVTAKSPIYTDHDCYEVGLSTGETLVADVNHLWSATSDWERRNGERPSVRTTGEMFEILSRRKVRFDIGKQAVLDSPRTHLPVDPYLLGYWLGDGTTGTGAISCRDDDIPSLLNAAELAGYEVVASETYRRHRNIYIRGLQPHLRMVGVLDRKHIPTAYLRAHVDDRLALLRGLADSDGSSGASHNNRRNTFYNANLLILDAFEDLVRSLGGVSSRRQIAAVGDSGGVVNGRAVVASKDLFAVSFTVPFPAFHLGRKKVTGQIASDRQRRIFIRSIRRFPTVPTACIEVDGPSHLFLAGRSMVPTHNCDLSHAYTLFAESTRKANPTQRGRFNMGEKMVIVLCESARITTTKGTLRFDADGRHHEPRNRLPEGSVFEGRIRMTREEYADAIDLLRRLIVPDGVRLTVNGEETPRREPIVEFTESLPTVLADAEGNLRPTERKTTVKVYEPVGTPTLYELGVPVVEIPIAYDVEVAQKIPLNMERDNVTPAYLRKVQTAVLNATYDRLDKAQATATWVSAALEDPNVESEAVAKVIGERFGPKAVIFDPSDREANDLAVARGYTVIPGGSFNRSQWDRIRDAGVRPAGQVTPSPTALLNRAGDPDAETYRMLDPADWTDAVANVASYARRLGKILLGFEPTVEVANDIRLPVGAMWCARTITFNRGRLGENWFRKIGPEVDALILHEFAHNRISGHLDARFADEIARLAGLLVEALTAKPGILDEWRNCGSVVTAGSRG